MNIKMLIVACNTVSSVALDDVRKCVEEEIPVIGVVIPCCKAAVDKTLEKKIGLVGTTATIRANSYTKIIKGLNPSIKVYAKECPLFVPLIEEGGIINNINIASSIVDFYLADLIDTGIDCLILGCTHYPLIMKLIQSAVNSKIEILDSAMWTAKEARNILDVLNVRSGNSKGGLNESTFFVTDFVPDFNRNSARFLGNKIPNIKKITLDQLISLTGRK